MKTPQRSPGRPGGSMKTPQRSSGRPGGSMKTPQTLPDSPGRSVQSGRLPWHLGGTDSLRPMEAESESGTRVAVAIPIPSATAHSRSAKGRHPEESSKRTHSEPTARGSSSARRLQEGGKLLLSQTQLWLPPRRNRMRSRTGQGTPRLQECKDSDQLRSRALWLLDQEPFRVALARAPGSGALGSGA